MASNDTFGLRRNVDKQIDLTIDEYIGSARPGELIVDLNPQGYGANAQYTVYVGKADGTLLPIVAGAPGSGTVTAVGTAATDPSALGFTLGGGPINTTGTVTLGVPTAAALRTALTIGNVANANFDGNVSNVLRGDGTWTAAPSPTSLTNGTTSVSIPVLNGNINLTSGGVQTVTVTSTGANITGYANITGDASIGGTLSVTGNVITPLTANAAVPSTSTGTGTIVVTGTGGIGVGGNIHVGANANVAGNLHALGNAILGSNANVFVTGGTAGQALTATGVGGALQWTTISTASISNGTSSVTIPVASGNVITTVGGVATITATSTGANITGYANVTGVISTTDTTASTSTTSGALVVAGGAGIAGNLNVGGNVAITGNVTTAIVANAAVPSTSTTTGTIKLTGTGGLALESGNVHVGGNANVAGNVHALGNLIINSAGGPGNVYIPGGLAGQSLVATGTGNLAWGYSAVVPRMSWQASADGINQAYANALLAGYTAADQFTVYKDGIALEPTTDYSVAGTTLTVIAWHSTGSVISTSAGVKQA